MATDSDVAKSRRESEIGSLLILFALGSLFSLTVLSRPVYAHFGMDPLMGFIPVTLAIISFGLAVTVAGKEIRQDKPGETAKKGGILMGLGFIATAGVVASDASFWVAAITMGVMVGAGAGLAFVPALSSLMRWFPEKRGARSSWAFTAFFFGALLLTLSASSLMLVGVDSEEVELSEAEITTVTDVDPDVSRDVAEDDNVDLSEQEVDDLYSDTGKESKRQQTLDSLSDGAYGRFNSPLALGVLGIIVIVLIYLGSDLITHPPKGYTPKGWEPADGGLSLDVTFSYRELMNDRIFIQLWLIMASGSAAGLMILFHITSFGVDFGARVADGGTMLSMFLLAATIGALLGGHMADRIGIPTMLFIFLLVQSLLLLMLIEVVTNTFYLVLTTSLYGFCFGMITSLFPPAAAEYFGSRGFVKNYGLLLSSLGVSALFAIFLVAYLVRDSGDYDLPIFLVTAPSLFATFLAFVTREPEKKLRAAARRESMEGEVGLADVKDQEKKKGKKKKAKKRKRKAKRQGKK